MGFMDKFADIFKERPEDDFDDFYDDTSSDFDMPPKPARRSSNLTRNVKVPKEEKPENSIVFVLIPIRLLTFIQPLRFRLCLLSRNSSVMHQV